MKIDDPRKVLDALLSGDDAALPFPPEAVARARALARGETAPRAPELEGLADPLALAVLEATVRARNPALAEALADSPQKALAKASKKALYQLRSVGVQVAEKKAAPAPAPSPAPSPTREMPCLLTPITGTGERAMIVVRPQRGGGLEIHQLVFTDEAGVTSVGSGDLNRGGYRKQLDELRAAKIKPAIEITLDEAREHLAEAVGTNLRSRTEFPPGLEELVRVLAITPREEPVAVPPPVDGDAQRAVDGHKLHNQPEILGWLPPETDLRRLALKMDEVLTSPLQLSDQQRGEQLLGLFRSAAEAFFTPEVKRLYGARLWKMAEWFERTGRPEPAELARAEARRLFHDAPGLFSRFGEFMFEKVLHLTQRSRGGEPLPPMGEAFYPPPGNPQASVPEAAAEKKSPGGLILP